MDCYLDISKYTDAKKLPLTNIELHVSLECAALEAGAVSGVGVLVPDAGEARIRYPEIL